MPPELESLKREFDAEEGSFLLHLCGRRWDRAAFTRPEQAMRAACERFQTCETFDRRSAEGFYEVAKAVRSWTAHPDFPRPAPVANYEPGDRLEDRPIPTRPDRMAILHLSGCVDVHPVKGRAAPDL